jgi:FkbM family methyltransferase
VDRLRSVLKRWVVRAPVGTARYWITLVTVVSRCGEGWRMQFKTFALGIVMPLRDRWLGGRDAKVRIRYGDLTVPWTVGPKSDFDVLNEVLMLKVHTAELPPMKPSTILDLGSHMGASVLFWRERFPDARIIAVEPDRVTFGRLQRNVGCWPGVELRNLAVAEEDGPVQFFSAQQGWVLSLSGNGEPMTVSGRSFRSLVREVGQADLLKVDIEGAEHYILDDCALQSVGAIVGEYHNAGDRGEREWFFVRLRQHFDLTVGQMGPFVAFFGSRKATSRRRPTVTA